MITRQTWCTDPWRILSGAQRTAQLISRVRRSGLAVMRLRASVSRNVIAGEGKALWQRSVRERSCRYETRKGSCSDPRRRPRFFKGGVVPRSRGFWTPEGPRGLVLSGCLPSANPFGLSPAVLEFDPLAPSRAPGQLKVDQVDNSPELAN